MRQTAAFEKGLGLVIDELIPVSVQDEPNYGMLWLLVNGWSLPWRDRDCWT
jgi:hypothetical protein